VISADIIKTLSTFHRKTSPLLNSSYRFPFLLILHSR